MSQVNVLRIALLLVVINSSAMIFVQSHTIKLVRHTMDEEGQAIQQQSSVIKFQTHVITVLRERLRRCAGTEVACPMHRGL